MPQKIVFLFEQDFSKPGGTIERFTGRQRAGRVDGRPIEFLRAPAARPVEVLKSESDGIHEVVASRASWIDPVTENSLTHPYCCLRRFHTILQALHRLKRRNVWRWRRNGSSQQCFEDPGASQNGACLPVMRRQRHHRPGIHHSRAAVIRPLHQLRLVAPKILKLVFQLIELHQAFGHVRVVGVEQFQQAAVLSNDSLKHQNRFGAKVGRDGWSVISLQLREHRGNAAAQLLSTQPLADKSAGERSRPWIVQHAIQLGLQDIRVLKFPLIRETDQFLVGHGGP